MDSVGRISLSVDRTVQRCLRLIFEYENRIERPTIERHVAMDGDGTIYPLGTVGIEDLIRYSVRCKNYLKFCAEIEACRRGRIPSESTLLFSKDTPGLLLELGLRNRSVTHNQCALRGEVEPVETGKDPSERGRHILSASLMSAIPELLERPWAVCERRNQKGELLLNVFVEQYDRWKLPVNAVIKPGCLSRYHGVTAMTNQLVSVYGHGDREPVPHPTAIAFIERARKKGNLLYFDHEKAERFLGRERQCLPDSLRNLDGIIRQTTEKRQPPAPHPGREIRKPSVSEPASRSPFGIRLAEFDEASKNLRRQMDNPGEDYILLV